ncbi:MAG: bifunctional oligoribonuclease/PAP phosphatase NrnA [Treponema sp.]|nr:bifunctional oligoribonuclease/PAP phosphatase NrnA [Treponema sp.]
MIDKLLTFIERYDFFILTTHDPADADGLGAQMVFTDILKQKEKKFKIINASPVPEHFKCMDPHGIVEHWNAVEHRFLPEQAAVLLLDTSDLHNIGIMRDPACRAKEVFVIDHHEQKPNNYFSGICDSNAASTSEMAVEIAQAASVSLCQQTALAAYIGIAYDTGFFAYPKTNVRTFRAALLLLESGVQPEEAYKLLYENTINKVLLLQKIAITNLKIHGEGKIAVQLLRQDDFKKTGTQPEDSDGFVNFPLKSREIQVSFLLKETFEGKVRCSLRSKGAINVSKLAHDFGGGGHKNAAGFKTEIDIDQTLAITLVRIKKMLDIK